MNEPEHHMEKALREYTTRRRAKMPDWSLPGPARDRLHAEVARVRAGRPRRAWFPLWLKLTAATAALGLVVLWIVPPATAPMQTAKGPDSDQPTTPLAATAETSTPDPAPTSRFAGQPDRTNTGFLANPDVRESEAATPNLSIQVQANNAPPPQTTPAPEPETRMLRATQARPSPAPPVALADAPASNPVAFGPATVSASEERSVALAEPSPIPPPALATAIPRTPAPEPVRPVEVRTIERAEPPRDAAALGTAASGAVAEALESTPQTSRADASRLQAAKEFAAARPEAAAPVPTAPVRVAASLLPPDEEAAGKAYAFRQAALPIPGPEVLRRFQLIRGESLVEVVDEDGSVYQQIPNPQAQAGRLNYFELAGTNKGLNQTVRFNGWILTNESNTAIIHRLAIPGGPEPGPVLQIQGSVRIGEGPELPIMANGSEISTNTPPP